MGHRNRGVSSQKSPRAQRTRIGHWETLVRPYLRVRPIRKGDPRALYAKLHAAHYNDALADKGLTTLMWWILAIAIMKPRAATPKPAIADRVVYTDAAGKSRIIAAAAFGPARFARNRTIDCVSDP